MDALEIAAVIFLVYVVLFALWIVLELFFAPIGKEDSEGFHFEKKGDKK